MMRLLKQTLILLFTTILVSTAFANSKQSQNRIAVVVHKTNSLQSLKHEDVVDLFMGKQVSSPDGNLLTPIDIEEGGELRELFYYSLTGLTLARVNAYWSRLKFTGRARPPKMVLTAKDVPGYLSQDKNAVGYLAEVDVTNDLKVLYLLNE